LLIEIMDFETLRTKFSNDDKTIDINLYRALSLEELNGLIHDADLSRPEVGQARLFHPSSRPGKATTRSCYCLLIVYVILFLVPPWPGLAAPCSEADQVAFNTFRSKFSEADQTITHDQYRALTIEELNALISDGHMLRPDAGRARLFHPSSGQGEASIVRPRFLLPT
jgi:hypothetical protein